MSFKTQDCVHESWLKFELKKASPISDLKDLMGEVQKDTTNQAIEEEFGAQEPLDTNLSNSKLISNAAFMGDFSKIGAQRSYIKPEAVPRRGYSGEERDEASKDKVVKSKKLKDDMSFKLDMFF